MGGVNTVVAISTLINSFCYIGVNCFILISGYYEITFKIRRVFELYLTCVFYSVIMHILEIYVLETKELSLGTLKDIVLVFSQQDYWWFISCYLILYMMSPILNKALDTFSKKESRICLILLAIVNLYLGYWWGRYNATGYNVAQFVFVYAIGRYLGRFLSQKIINNRRNELLLMYIGSIFIYTVCSICAHYTTIPHWKSFPYNNPILILGAISFFLYMCSFHFQSKIINKLSMSVLSIYLLQRFEIMKFIVTYTSDYFNVDFGNANGVFVIVFLLVFLAVFSIIFSILSLFIDQFRLFFIRQMMTLCDKCDKRKLLDIRLE